LSEQVCTAKKVIAALVPCYHNNYGNATEIIYLGKGSSIVPRTVKTVLKNIAKEYAIDIKASREKYGKLLGCGRAAPIPLDRETILIPLKMRRVISKNDSARGYINCLTVKDVEDKGEGNTCLVVLRDDRTVKCLHSKRNIKQHINNCYLVRTKLSEASEADGQLAEDYLNCPATKSDIAMLLKEIRELGEKM
jgi:hypothetical protein